MMDTVVTVQDLAVAMVDTAVCCVGLSSCHDRLNRCCVGYSGKASAVMDTVVELDF